MIIYPTIELQKGRCVSLRRGDLAQAEIWHVDPIKTARRFAAAGAQWIHVTDLDGVLSDGAPGEHRDLLIELIRGAGVPLQLSGGFRSYEAIEEWIDLGTGRIVVGTLAATQPEIVKRAARRYPDQISIAVDVYQGRVMIHGWRETSALDPKAFIAAYAEDPLASIVVTDIDVDIDQADVSLALVTELAAHAQAPVIASGLVRGLDDISRLKYVPGVSGALVGRALFNRSVALEEALAVATAAREPTADFV